MALSYGPLIGEPEEEEQGFSPQRGSALPPAIQGGLPFGASSPTQPKTVAAPSFQRAPLTSIGGGVPDPEQMLAERLRAIQGYQPGKSNFDQQLAYVAALKQIPALTGIINTKSQERQFQQQYLKEIAGNLKEWSGLNTEQKFQQKGLTKKLLLANVKLARLDADEKDVDEVLTSENISGAFIDLFDPTIPERDQLARLQRLGSVKGKEREEVAKTIRAEDDERAQTVIAENMPDVIRRFGGSRDNPIDTAELDRQIKADPQISQLLKGSPVLARNLTSFLSNEKNAETLAGWGVKVGKTALKEQELKATEAIAPKFPHLAPYAETLLPFMVKGSGLTHVQLNQMATTDSNRFVATVKGAQELYDQNLDRRAKEQGLAAAEARLKTPEKASATEREKLLEDSNNLALSSVMQKLYHPEFVGPVTGRTAWIRENWTGDMKEREATFRQQTTSFNNALIKALGGVVVPPAEFERIMAERPHMNLPPVTFEARMRQSHENLLLLAHLRRNQLAKTGVDVSGLDPLPPLPEKFNRLMVNPGKTTEIEAKPPAVKRSGMPTRTR